MSVSLEEMEALQQPQLLDPLGVLEELTLQYMDFAMGVKNDPQLNVQVKAQAMLQMAQALNYLVPMLPSSKRIEKEPSPADLVQKQAEMEMRAQEHAQKLQLKAAEVVLKEQQHQQQLIHNEQRHQQRLRQQRQASQLKQRKNNSKSNQSKNG